MATIDIPAPGTDSRPTHLWVIGGLSLLWNAFGAFDYLMTELRVESYLESFTPEQLAYFTSFPAWFVAAWALGVWGAVAGSVGLLLRQRWAAWAFGVSLLGLFITTVYSYAFSDGFEAAGGGLGVILFNLVIWVVAIALFLYARAMVTRGVLR